MLLSELAQAISASLWGDDASFCELSVANRAKNDDVAIFLWPKDLRALKNREVRAVLADRDFAADYADKIDTAWLVVNDLPNAFEALAALQNTNRRVGIARTAKIHPSAFIDENTSIGEGTIIMPGARILSGSYIGHHVVIGANTVIGSQPFCPYGLHPSRLLPSLGAVEIHEQVKIGANCTVARGLVSSTTIGAFSLLDDQVHIGHDSLMGENVIIAGQTAIAGLVEVGNNVTIGGQAGIGPHVEVGEGSRISGRAGVVKDVEAYHVVSGFPARPHQEFLRFEALKNREQSL